MFDLLVNAEGGLTTAGYVVTISVGIVLFLAAVFFAGKRSKRQKMTTKQLVFCAAAMALAFVTSYVKIFQMPWGGSVTLCSMLFIVLVANRSFGRSCLWNPAVYTGTVCTFFFPSVL